MILGVSVVSYALYDQEFDFQAAVIFLLGYILLMILVFAVTSYLSLTSAIRRLPKDNKGMIGDHCFIVDDAWICEQAGPVETKVKWNAIRKVSISEDHAFIYYAPNQAFIVPKRAFADEYDFNRFARDCISRLPESL